MKILDIPQSGKRGVTVSYQSPFGLCSRAHFVPKRTVTPARERMWGVFGSNSQMWSRTLSEDQRHRWCAAGAKVMSYPRLGQKGPLSGQQFWQSISSVRGCVGLPADLEPPAPVVFDPSPAGRLIIENGPDGVRMYVAVSGDLATDIMVFGQEPCSAGRYKRRNVAYMGLCYSKGIGVQQSDENALKWYLRAAEQRCFSYHEALGDFYHYGRGVPRDYCEAYKYYNLAAGGAAWFKDGLASLTAKMTPSQIEEGERRIQEFRRTHPEPEV